MSSSHSPLTPSSKAPAQPSGRAPSDSAALAQVVAYMQAHWPSQVKPEWQVSLEEYPALAEQAFQDFLQNPTHQEPLTPNPTAPTTTPATPPSTTSTASTAVAHQEPPATSTHQLIRIAGLSGSGKTSQILPAVEAYCARQALRPVLVAARYFVKYHPHAQAIEAFYGSANLRKNTDEFSTIMMFILLNLLTKHGVDVILDVTLLDPAVEQILLHMLTEHRYHSMLLMIATSPTVTEHFLGGRAWRHTKATEQEFIRATTKALDFYATHSPSLRTILWSVYDLPPIYDGPIQNALPIFADYSSRTTLPAPDDAERRAAKISYLANLD